MGPLDALWHLLNFFGPAVGLGLIASSLAKALWRRELASARWADLARWTIGVGAAVSVIGLALQGRDGRMATYALMVLAVAATLWWRGWGRRPR